MNKKSEHPEHDPRITGECCAISLKTVADATRLTVLIALANGSALVGELAHQLNIEQSLLSHHLKTLRDGRFVVSTREGKAVRYALAPNIHISRHGKDHYLDLGCCLIRLQP